MTSYRYPVLVLLVALVTGGWFGLAQANLRSDSQYEAHLAAARSSVELGVTSDAVAEFSAALSLRPSYEVAWEMAEFLRTDGDPEDYRRTLADLVRGYPDRPEPYLALARADVESQELGRAYDTLVQAIDEGVADDAIVNLRRELRYQYSMGAQSFDEARSFVGDLAAIRMADGWIIANGEGSSLSRTFEQAGVLSEGMINVVVDGRPVYIDRQGEVALEATRVSFVEYGPIARGVIPARSADGQVTYLDTRFRGVLDGQTYADGTSFAGGLAAVSNGTEWSVLDPAGETVAGPFVEVARSDGDAIVGQDRFFAKTTEGFRMYDLTGAVVGTGVYEDARPFGPFGAAAVQVEGQWGFVDAAGAEVVTPAYDDARSFVNGVAAVAVGDSWGYINDTGEVVIPVHFAAATDFTADGAAMVALRGLDTGTDPSVDADPAAPSSAPTAPTTPAADTGAPESPAPEADASPGEPDVRDAIRWQMLKLKRFEG